MINETKKILHRPDLKISATCVRVPVPNGHGVSIVMRAGRDFKTEEVISALKAQEGIVLKDVASLCRDVCGTDWVAVGRVRKSAADERELLLYCVADNLLRGAAANAVKIAEGIFCERWFFARRRPESVYDRHAARLAHDSRAVLSGLDTRRYLLSLFSDAECEKRELSCGSVALFFDFGKENTAAFRCELDALPVNELNESAYKSNRKLDARLRSRRTYGCLRGSLQGFGRAFGGRKEQGEKNALVLFQSGEESAGSAQAVVDSGILAETRTDRIFALHLWPETEKRQSLFDGGRVSGSKRRGGHNDKLSAVPRCGQRRRQFGGGGAPAAFSRKGGFRNGKRKKPLSAQIRQADRLRNLPNVRSGCGNRSIERALKGVSSCNERPSGARNVIGGGFKLEGTLRAVEPRAFCRAKEKINAAVCDSRDKGFAVFCEIREGSGAVCNCARLFALAQEAANVGSLPAPFLQAEDFSVYGKVCPSLYMFLGVGEVPPLHSPYFDFDESVLEKGLETFLRLFQ